MEELVLLVKTNGLVETIGTLGLRQLGEMLAITSDAIAVLKNQQIRSPQRARLAAAVVLCIWNSFRLIETAAACSGDFRGAARLYLICT